jgi:ATP-dependent helicase/DNAse subunit B
MSLNKKQLVQDLTTLYENTMVSEANEVTAKDDFIKYLANAIDSYVKSATIRYTGGLTAPNGPVSGTFNHTIE